MNKFNNLDDVHDALETAKDLAFKYGLVEYASMIERLANKVKIEADYFYDQHKKAEAALDAVQLNVIDFMGMQR